MFHLLSDYYILRVYESHHAYWLLLTCSLTIIDSKTGYHNRLARWTKHTPDQNRYLQEKCHLNEILQSNFITSIKSIYVSITTRTKRDNMTHPLQSFPALYRKHYNRNNKILESYNIKTIFKLQGRLWILLDIIRATLFLMSKKFIKYYAAVILYLLT